MRAQKLALKGKGWWHDIREHRYAVLVWLILNLLDFGLTQIGYTTRPDFHELGFWISLSLPLFAAQKFFLTIAAIMWLAIWRWLRFLKWLNLLWVALVCWDIYQLMKF